MNHVSSSDKRRVLTSKLYKVKNPELKTGKKHQTKGELHTRAASRKKVMCQAVLRDLVTTRNLRDTSYK